MGVRRNILISFSGLEAYGYGFEKPIVGFEVKIIIIERDGVPLRAALYELLRERPLDPTFQSSTVESLAIRPLKVLRNTARRAEGKFLVFLRLFQRVSFGFLDPVPISSTSPKQVRIFSIVVIPSESAGFCR